MNARRGGLGFALLVAAAVVLVLALRAPRRDSIRSAEQEGPPTSVFEGVELVHQDADGTSWHLSAREGSAREAEGSASLSGVKVEFEKGGKKIRMEAGEADVRASHEVRLFGGVEIFWSEYVARMDQATYYRGEGLIRSPDPVSLRGPGLELTGRGVEVDVEGRVARVNQDVRAVVRGGVP